MLDEVPGLKPKCKKKSIFAGSKEPAPRPKGLSITHKLSSNHDPQLKVDETG